jgi:hypothetical protein
MRGNINNYTILVRKPEENKLLEKLGVDGRIVLN